MKLINNIRKVFDPNSEKHWDSVYANELNQGLRRTDNTLLQCLDVFENASSVLDFGSGPGGNIQTLSEKLENIHFTLLDISDSALHSAEEILGKRDARKGHEYTYVDSIKSISDSSQDVVMAIEVIEHIKNYREAIKELWRVLVPNGLLLISVPVRGIRDRHREHVNKFTISRITKLLLERSDEVMIRPRSYSRRSGILATAYFISRKVAHKP